MTHNIALRAWLVALIALTLLIRLHFSRKVVRPAQRISLSQLFVIISSFAWTGSLVGYAAGLVASISAIPVWMRWTGVMGMLASILFSIQVYRALGKQFYTDLRIGTGHVLVTVGPYRIVRHPMYAVLILCVWSSVLLTASVAVLCTGALLTLVILLRIIPEEKLLREHFGTAYELYARTTPAVLPIPRFT